MKNIIKITTLFFAVALIFSACNKSNVNYGNKRIVGTWIIDSYKFSYEGIEKESRTYSSNTCGNENYSGTEIETGDEELIGNSLHIVETERYIEVEGGVTILDTTIVSDTTYTTNNTYEITFNEDGTFTEKSYREYSYSYYNGNNRNEHTGQWFWIDGYKEKEGINLVYKISYGYEIEQTIRIESLKKDELILKFEMSYKEIYEEVEKDEDCNDNEIFVTDREEYEEKGSGTRTLKKQ